MSELKEQEVYVPMKGEPEKDGEYACSMLHENDSDEDSPTRDFILFYSGRGRRAGVEEGWTILEHLEPRNGYFHTKDQLIELANRIWEAARDWQLSRRVGTMFGPAPDQTTFINSLFEKEESNG